MQLKPELRTDAEELLGRMLAADTEEAALAVLTAAAFPNLPAVAGAALVILASQTTQAKPEGNATS